MNITVVEHNPYWKEEYLKEEREIKEILRGALVNSFHIGSISVPGLKARPIIDILLAVKYPNDIEGYGDGKDDFVKKIEKQALIWHWTVR